MIVLAIQSLSHLSMKKIGILIINLYQITKPIFNQIVWTIFGFKFKCQQIPSCSEYTKQKIKTKGLVVGFYLGFSRMINCH